MAVFEGNQPNIRFTLTTDTGNTQYDLRFKRLIEFNDTLGTGVFRHQSDAIIQRANLDVANWSPAFYAIKQGSNTIGIGVNFTNSIQITSGGSGSVPVTPLWQKPTIQPTQKPSTAKPSRSRRRSRRRNTSPTHKTTHSAHKPLSERPLPFFILRLSSDSI